MDIIKGEAIQSQILRALEDLSSQGRIGDDAIFFKLLAKGLGSKPNKSFLKVYRDYLGEKDEMAEVVFAAVVLVASKDICWLLRQRIRLAPPTKPPAAG